MNFIPLENQAFSFIFEKKMREHKPFIAETRVCICN